MDGKKVERMTASDELLWEERRTTLRDGAAAAYCSLYLRTVWPGLQELGGRPLGLFNGLIGTPMTEFVAITGYRSVDDYAQAQRAGGPTVPGRAELVHSERVRLLRDCGVRPKAVTPVNDRRPVYGVRSFSIAPADWAEFVRLSAEGVWPRIESQGARILGMFRDLAATEPLDVLLLTGYHGPANWEAARGLNYPRPEDFPEDRWQRAIELSRARASLVIRSHVALMQAHWPE